MQPPGLKNCPDWWFFFLKSEIISSKCKMLQINPGMLITRRPLNSSPKVAELLSILLLRLQFGSANARAWHIHFFSPFPEWGRGSFVFFNPFAFENSVTVSGDSGLNALIYDCIIYHCSANRKVIKTILPIFRGIHTADWSIHPHLPVAASMTSA